MARAPTLAPAIGPRFWWTHAFAPLAAFVACISIIALAGLDQRIAAALFHDAATGAWIGRGSWWAEQLLHDGGRNAVRLLGLAGLALLIASRFRDDLRHWQRPAAYFVVSLLLVTGLAGGLKALTNVDCPWDLQQFGGTRPYVGLLEDRPDALPHAACFPGAHSSSGFALLCLYFLLRHRGRVPAALGLAAGLVTGAVFSFAQQARGAHFLSHDLWSLAIAWYTCLGLYVRVFGADLACVRPACGTRAARRRPVRACR